MLAPWIYMINVIDRYQMIYMIMISDDLHDIDIR